MTLKAAFIFIAPEADPAQHRALVKTPEVEVTTLAVTSYAQAEQVVQELVAAGIVAIELCGGFGYEGSAMVARAVKVPVGVVRFDIHPGLGNVSGDGIFA